ncbi:LrgB family protein [Arcobacter sp. LA11]|uniref:LrgB family protein n=1 Tax=Arcobacter sp. LA11 TaxID=1898176 RepID=UPI0009321020|nr:LrgB family protein [Arcobacter sp. LA11]
MNFDALIEYINTTPLTWLILTLVSYKFGIIIYTKFNKHTLLQPIIISYIIILTTVLITDTPYKDYFKSVEIINFFLGPATVSLALPLFNNLKHIKALFIPIIITLSITVLFSIAITASLLWILDAQLATILSMTTKSVTAPIAIITSEQIGAIPSLAIGFVIITGILGAILGTSIFKFMKIKHDSSKGFALGIISHAIGTARAIEISERAAAFSALAMGIGGIFTAIILPLLISFLP